MPVFLMDTAGVVRGFLIVCGKPGDVVSELSKRLQRTERGLW